MTNYAVVLLDESGSMTGQETRVVGSLNEYAASIAKHDPKLTVFCFDSERWRELFDGKATDWKNLEPGAYMPKGMTPLYDSIHRAIAHVEQQAKEGDKVMVMVDTDGVENASKEHTQDSIKALIEFKKALGWEFLFMASGINEVVAQRVGTQGRALGMNVESSTYANRGATYNVAERKTSSLFAGES